MKGHLMENWKSNIVNEMKKKMDEGHVLEFVHTPKCSGRYAREYLRDLGIKNNGHHRPNKNHTNRIFFTIIREPAARFESQLNWRLGQWGGRLTSKSRKDIGVPKKKWDKSMSLNDIMEQMTDKQIVGFRPYRSLVYWSQGVDLLITVDELLPTLKLLGFDIVRKHKPKGVSKKNRGILSVENIRRLRNIFSEDVQLFKHWTRND
tara:strand:- start:533 stop:1147 length:615 start_codon:yes stop_codon:yes gene_type:complete